MKQDKLTMVQQKLVIDHLRLVHKVIRSVVLGPYDYEELYACGCEFLCMAAYKYDRTRSSCTFSTFAYIVIKRGLLQYLEKENRFRMRKMDYDLEKIVRVDLDTIVEDEVVKSAIENFAKRVSNIPIRRGLKVLYEHVVKDESLENLAKQLGVSRNTEYLNMVGAREYIRNSSVNEKRWLLPEEHHLLKKEETVDE